MEINSIISSEVMEIVVRSFKNVKENKKVSKRNLRSELIKTISKGLEEKFRYIDDYVVFSRENDNKDFQRNEFLYDIHLCKRGIVKSPINNSQASYIKESLAIIQSKFEDNSEDCIGDFSKLIVGNAPLKIMILPKKRDVESYLKPIKVMGENIKESLYCVFFPEKSQWNTCIEYEIYELYNNNWERVI